MKHATQMSIDFIHNGDYDEDAILEKIEKILEEHGLEYRAVYFESVDENYPETEE